MRAHWFPCGLFFLVGSGRLLFGCIMVAPFESLQRLPLEPRDIGGELLDILSRGLYSEARDAIREYAQNGIDAEASKIWVQVDGPRAVIHDDGVGMDWEQITRARRFGMSDKTAQENVGFRGIGIYSAFGMCDSLEIATHQKGEPEEFTVRFNFGAMRDILERDRAGDERAGVALGDLLYEYVGFSREPYDFELGDDQGTVVTLDGIDQEYRAQLADASELGSYLLNTLPVSFPESEYGPAVNRWLGDKVGIRAVQVSLKVGIEPEEHVEPRIVYDLDPPEFEWVCDPRETPVAGVWYSHSQHRSRLGSRSPEDDSGDAGGFLFKLKGFTLGNRLSLKSLWPRLGGGTLYHHFTGEVHILDAAHVFPNAARDGLEPSLAQQNLERYLSDLFERLNRRADLTREINLAAVKIPRLRTTLGDILRQFESEDSDPYELYRVCRNHSDQLVDTERRMLRLTRGRKAIRPTTDQRASLDSLRSQMADLMKTTDGLSQRAQRLTESRGRRQTSGPQHRPQAAVLSRALNALTTMYETRVNSDNESALRTLRAAVQAQSISRAVAVLDGLKAEGSPLSDAVEASRQELRGSLGWSPTGPVSLNELLDDLGLSNQDDRERTSLIRALDRGLLEASGGRGEKYETALNAVADELTQDINGQ